MLGSGFADNLHWYWGPVEVWLWGWNWAGAKAAQSVLGPKLMRSGKLANVYGSPLP